MQALERDGAGDRSRSWALTAASTRRRSPARIGPGRSAQLQRRRVRLAVSEVRRRSSAHVQPAGTPGIKKIAKSKPVEHGLPFSTWSLSKLADFLVAEGVVDDISREGLRVLLRDEGVSFQRI